MANPYYNRTYAFSSGTTARGSEVKAEFDGIVAGLDSVDVDVKRAITMPAGTTVELPTVPADRALTVIGFDSNGDVEVQAGIGAFQGDWATGTDYLVRDIMLDAGGELGLNNVYICNVAHTSSASLATDSANWDLMIDVTDVKASEVAAAASAAAALVSEGLADADATQTAADRVQTGLDRAATAANVVLTNQDAINTAADLVATNQNAIDTAADVVLTNADVVTTGNNATAAGNAQAAAEAAQAAAELAYDNFDDRYLGSKASNPTLDNDGQALLDGALYFNTTANEMRVYDLGGTTWISIQNYTHPNHTGDVTSTGDGATVIASDAVDNTKLANMATQTIKGRNTAATGDPEDLTAAQVRGILNVEDGATADQTKADIDALNIDADTVDGFEGVELKSGRKNYIINGNFNIWQRGASFTNPSVNDYTADRWQVISVGGGMASVNQILNQDSDQGRRHLQFTSGTSVTYNEIQQRIERISRFRSSKTYTLSFLAKATSAVSLSAITYENYGDGGSTTLTTTTNHSVTTSWTKFTQQITLSDYSAKTLGNNNFLGIGFRVNDDNLTVEIAQVQLEEGSVATDFEYRPIGEELALCQRYYYGHVNLVTVPPIYNSTTNLTRRVTFVFPVPMRATPSVNIIVHSNFSGTPSVTSPSIHSINFQGTATGVTNGTQINNFSADAEL